MTILLYQSELVRLKSCTIKPSRIRAAKSKCLSYALSIADNYNFKCEKVPEKYWSTTITPWNLYCAVILINHNFNFPQHRLNSNDPRPYEKFIKNMFNSAKHYQIVQSIHGFILHLYSVKQTQFLKYKKTMHKFIHLMVAYGLFENDVYPWIVPRYATFIKFICCFESNYTSIDVRNYLFLSDEIESSAESCSG
ncbi:hypothetical protein AYI68_g3256 [Smittium mucronatum]|uniref:Uncharacterized protein n=1 Tax=Smittium mucronatum TaxID=133383 RepID=A0A1R0H0G5_9FUNG|nr:hypothetical protein AYI68_g3256 [Smittium mucronatum]